MPIAPLTIDRFDPDCAPKGVPLLVAGGIAMKKTGGEWFSGISDQPFTRPLNWAPKWWAPIPEQTNTRKGSQMIRVTEQGPSGRTIFLSVRHVVGIFPDTETGGSYIEMVTDVDGARRVTETPDEISQQNAWNRI